MKGEGGEGKGKIGVGVGFRVRVRVGVRVSPLACLEPLRARALRVCEGVDIVGEGVEHEADLVSELGLGLVDRLSGAGVG